MNYRALLHDAELRNGASSQSTWQSLLARCGCGRRFARSPEQAKQADQRLVWPPARDWLRKYNLRTALADAMAALVVSGMMIPQTLACTCVCVCVVPPTFLTRSFFFVVSSFFVCYILHYYVFVVSIIIIFIIIPIELFLQVSSSLLFLIASLLF